MYISLTVVMHATPMTRSSMVCHLFFLPHHTCFRLPAKAPRSLACRQFEVPAEIAATTSGRTEMLRDSTAGLHGARWRVWSAAQHSEGAAALTRGPLGASSWRLHGSAYFSFHVPAHSPFHGPAHSSFHGPRRARRVAWMIAAFGRTAYYFTTPVYTSTSYHAPRTFVDFRLGRVSQAPNVLVTPASGGHTFAPSHVSCTEVSPPRPPFFLHRHTSPSPQPQSHTHASTHQAAPPIITRHISPTS